MNARHFRLALATVLISYAFAATSLASLELPWLFADHMVIQRDVPVPVWGTGTPGSTITVAFGGQDHQTGVDAAGKWMVTLKAMPANAQGRVLRVSSNSGSEPQAIQDVLVGEVWLCAGQSNMWYPLKSCAGGKDAAAAAGNPAIRLLNRRGNAYPAGGAWKPATLEKCTAEKYYSGTWVIDTPESAAQFSGVAYWFGKKLHAELNVPIGLINIAVGGTTTEAYTSREGLLSHPRLRPIVESESYWFDNETVSAWPRKRAKGNLSEWLKHKKGPLPRHPFEPSFLFESGIAPLVPMAFRGAIWYQGESNATGADNVVPVPKAHVRAGIETMICDWRAQWKRDFPFLYVQLPGMGRPWELFREVQRECLDIANTGMAISIDVGNPRDVHPKNKQPVGERLALWALGTTYGKDLVYSGPLYQGEGDRGQAGGRLQLRFEHTGTGLSTRDGKGVRGFEVAGADGVYHPAQATIDDHVVWVRSSKVPKPIAARYAWAPFPDCNLVNSASLPASPFRTDTPTEDTHLKRIGIVRSVKKPKHYFKPHPEHHYPDGMVAQDFEVHYTLPTPDAADAADFKYEIVSGKGNARFAHNENVGRFSSRADNVFIADAYGRNVLRISKRTGDGSITSIDDDVFVHFARQQVAGGNPSALDLSQGKDQPAFVKGIIDGDNLTYAGMRYFPQSREGLDTSHESGKFGFYVAKEPRIFRTTSGTLLLAYHAAIKEHNDAAAGMATVVKRSTDGGVTWTNERALAHDGNAVTGWTAMVQHGKTIQLYFATGHRANKTRTAMIGVYRCVSTDEGRTWSPASHQAQLTALLNKGEAHTIGSDYFPTIDGFTVDNLVWKGTRGTALIIPFYVGATFVISMDGGETWEVFFNPREHDVVTNECTLVPLDNGLIYVVSRVQWLKDDFKHEYLLNHQGELVEYFRDVRRNHRRTKCHHGSAKITSGPRQGHVAFLSHGSPQRENGTLAISSDAEARSFDTRWLTFGGGWGYCDVEWMPEEEAIIAVAECEPFNETTRNHYGFAKSYGHTLHNERFSIQQFKFSLAFWDSLISVTE